jgi:hypothetical protein
MSKCSEVYCPWVQSRRNPDRYVCLKCNQVRRVDWQTGTVDGIHIAVSAFIVFILWAIAL